jgi:hypothetical protein
MHHRPPHALVAVQRAERRDEYPDSQEKTGRNADEHDCSRWAEVPRAAIVYHSRSDIN